MGELWILQVESAGFADRLDVGCERERGVKDDSQAGGLSHQKHGAATS